MNRRVAVTVTAERPAASEPTELPGPRGAGGAAAGAGDAAHGPHRAGFAGELRILTRGSSMGLIGQGVNALLAFAFSVAVGRLFHAKGAGTFFVAVAIFTIAANVGDLGADDGLFWAVPRLRAEGRTGDLRRLLPIACLPVLAVSCALAGALLLWAVPLAHLFSHGQHDTHLASFIRILAPFVPVAALMQPVVAGTRGFDRVWPQAAIWSFVMPAVRLLLLPILLATGMGLLAVAYSWATPVILGGLALLFTLFHFVEREHRGAGGGAPLTAHRTLARTFWGFSAPRALASICSMALVWLDVLLVGWIVSMRMAGIYAVANRYLVVVTFALAAVGATIGPQVSRLLALGKVDELRRLYQASTSWVMAIAWPCTLIMAVYSPILMKIFGHEFAAGDTALSILALMMLYVSATGSNVVVLVMSGSSRTSLLIGIGTLACNVGANLLLIPHFGIDGAAAAWAVSLLVSNVAINTVLYRRLGLHPFGPGSFTVALAAVSCVGVLAVAARLVLGQHWPALGLTAAVGGAAYLAVLWRARHRLELKGLSLRGAG
jgi:O-antigen/teichoic acid export membrane protein